MKTVGDAEVERRVVPCSTWSETFVPVAGKEIDQITVDGVPQTITDPLSHTVTQTGGSAEIRVKLRKIVVDTGEVRPIQPGRGYQFDGTTDTLMRSMAGITITSWEGSATLSIPGSQDRINATAGTAWDIRLSDGTLYKCDEAGGTLAIDSSGNGNDATISTSNLASFHAELIDGADWQNQVGSTPNIRFNGLTGTSGIALTNSVNAQFMQHPEFTFQSRFVVDDLSTVNLIIGNWNAGVAGNFEVYVETNGAILVFHQGTTFYNGTAGQIVAGTEYHLAWVRTGLGANQNFLYLNGTQIGNFTFTNTATSANILRIGQTASNVVSNSFIGWQRNIIVTPSAIWTGAFTAPETWEDYQALETTNPSKWAIYNAQTVNNPNNLPITLSADTHSHFVPRDESNPIYDAYTEPLFFVGPAAQ